MIDANTASASPGESFIVTSVAARLPPHPCKTVGNAEHCTYCWHRQLLPLEILACSFVLSRFTILSCNILTMDDPVRDITKVIHALCQSPPSVQHATIEKYFAPDASFLHPLCRTGSFGRSRILIEYIYRWYKILSPRIDLRVYSIGKFLPPRSVIAIWHDDAPTNVHTLYLAFDEPNLLLYVSLQQTFRIQFLPFHRADAHLTTVLQLTRSIKPPGQSLPTDDQTVNLPVLNGAPKYYIQSQNDLYQSSELVKFIVPWFHIGNLAVMAWQFFVTLQCVILATIFQPLAWIEESVWSEGKPGGTPGAAKDVKDR